ATPRLSALRIFAEMPNSDGADVQTTVKLSKGQRYRRNRAAKLAAAAAGELISTQQTQSSPLQPGEAQPPLPRLQRRKSKQVRRFQQTTPSAFLKLPADILAQIVPYLAPLDVIYLTRVNVSVRQVLMHRSARPMWQACIENMGLPACPPGLSEPRYVSILYLPFCTACGAKEPRNPDAYLLVRLCTHCRQERLVDWRKVEPAEVQALVLASEKSRTASELYVSGLKHSLKKEVKLVKSRLRWLRRSKDEEALQTWVQARTVELERRKEHADLVTNALKKAHKERINKLKQNWNERVQRQLLALGYTQKEEDLPLEKRSRWRSFFNRTDVLTRWKWQELKPEMIRFLEAEMKDRPERERIQRRSSRNTELCSLFSSVQHVKSTLPEVADEPPAAERAIMMAEWLPPPTYDDALEWPVIQELLETDRPVAEMSNSFEERRHEIIQQVENWGKQVKRDWANILREGRKSDGLVADPPRPRPETDGTSADPFENFDADTCLLLRADSIFSFERRYDSTLIRTYDSMVMALSPGGWSYDARNDGKLDLTDYTWDSQGSSLARTFLQIMGKQDVSSVEFNAWPGRLFACGRCSTPVRSWLSIIDHYEDEASAWGDIQDRLASLAELNIIYNHVHDLESNNPKPLIRLLSTEEAEAIDGKSQEDAQTSIQNGSTNGPATPSVSESGASSPVEDADQVEPGDEHNTASEENDEAEEDDTQSDYFKCKLCEQGKIKTPFFSKVTDLFPHLTDVHDMLDPQWGTHGEDPDSAEDNPYIRLCEPEEFETGCGWHMNVWST
ncbi:hypothetical protein FS749_002184, partial [Ceratobasidium sp. UAMH 11750]